MAYGLITSATLNGSTQYFSASDSASLSPTGNQTHEGWIKWASTPSSGNGVIVFSKYAASGTDRGIAMSYENSAGTLRFHVRTSSDGSTVSEGTLNYTVSTGSWNHYRFVYSTAGSVQIYVDQVSIGTISSLATSIKDNAAAYQIGFNTDIDGHIAAQVSLWRVWDTTHTTNDVCTVYGTTTTNLQAEWSLDSVLTDGSGNSNTLTNNGSATFTADVPSVCTAVTSSSKLALLGVG